MNIYAKSILHAVVALLLLAASTAASAGPQTTFFNYQGQLQDNGAPANGSYDLAFELYDDATAGTQVGGTLTSPGHSVTGGLFSLGLNFGSTVFDGTQLWLQVYVNGIAMTPRTAIRLAPVAEYALTAASVDPGSITASMLSSNSVTRAKLVGASASGNANFNVPAGTCLQATFAVTGAQVGDLPVIAWASGVTPPVGIVLGTPSVTAADTVKANVCNLRATDYSTASIAVTLQTFR